jgi:hypothetical protein
MTALIYIEFLLQVTQPNKSSRVTASVTEGALNLFTPENLENNFGCEIMTNCRQKFAFACGGQAVNFHLERNLE